MAARSLFRSAAAGTRRRLCLSNNTHLLHDPILPSLQEGRHRASSFAFFSHYANDEETDESSGPSRTALVLGSSGALGSVVSRYLSKDLGWQVLGADVVELPSDLTLDWELDGFVKVPRNGDLTSMTLSLVRGVNYFVHGKPSLNAIICASGGWQGDPPPPAFEDPGNLGEREAEEGAMQYVEAIETMRRVNLDPLVAAGYIAQHYMSRNGLFVSIGATAALSPTPGMMGYGLSKAASHHFVATMGASTGKSIEPKSMRKAGRRVRKYSEGMDSMSVVGILPTTIDTSANRRSMPKANFEQWTKPLDIAKEIGSWLETPSLRPHSGSLVKVHPRSDGAGASFELVR